LIEHHLNTWESYPLYQGEDLLKDPNRWGASPFAIRICWLWSTNLTWGMSLKNIILGYGVILPKLKPLCRK